MSEGGELRRRIVLGLGNPGERYAETRHNVGFRVVEEVARRNGAHLKSGECNSLVASAVAPARETDGEKTLLHLAAPQTYMNRSGYAARCFRERHGVEPEDFLVVYDEVHLGLGRLRVRRGGSPAGHRGMESILENLETDQVPRLRLGVGADVPPAGDALVDFVLAPFEEDEREAVDEMIRRAAEACETWARDGIDAAMQQFNG